MKRSLENDNCDANDTRADAVAAFNTAHKKRAKDVCNNLTDVSGYIEGTVHGRETANGDCWEFVLLVERGFCAHLLLSGAVSRWFNRLPIVFGAQVRIDLKGVALEDLPSDKVKRLVLPKKFVWREGVVVHILNPKSGEEAFLNTWTSESTDAILASQALMAALRTHREPH